MQNLNQNYNIENLFQGDQQGRGVLISNINGDKDAYFEKKPIDWRLHLKGEKVQGISPINAELNKAQWLCCDIDLKIDPTEFCAKIFNKLGPQYFPFRTMNKRWRVVEFLDDWQNLDYVKSRSKELEKKIIKECGYQCDSSHTLPLNAGWVFMPYHNNETVCYSPGGIPLTKEQFEFRARYKTIPLIVSAIGIKLSSDDFVSRDKAFFAVALYKKHYPSCTISLEELNNNFTTPWDPYELQKEINKTNKQIDKERYDKQYLLNGIPKWCEEMCGVRPYIEDNFIEDHVAPELVKNFVYCNQNSDFYDIKTDTFKNKEQMNDWWAHFTKGKSIVKQLLLNPSLQKVWSVFKHPAYTPGVITIKSNEIKGIKAGDYLNYYKPSEVQGIPGDHNRFVEYYKWLFQSEDKIIYKDKTFTQFDIVMMFLANLLQYPGRKAMWGILMQSVPGSGKGLLAEIIESILGQSNCLTNVSFDALVKDHSTLLLGKQFMVINELMLTGKRVEGKELANKLKPYFTDPVHIINPKFKEEILCPNFVNLFLYSNDSKPLHIDKDDRRICVIRVNRRKEEIIDKIENYVPYLRELVRDPSAIKHYLSNLELPDERFFGGHAPITEAKNDLIGYSKDDFESILDEAFINKSYPFNSKFYADNTVYTYRGYIQIDNFYEALKYDPLFRGIYFDRNKLLLWIKNNCIPWANGELNRQMHCNGRERRRAWLLEDIKDYHFGSLSEWSPSTLGQDYEKFKFVPKTTSLIPTPFKTVEKEKGRNAHCWSCKSEITFEEKTQCKNCLTGILCKCGACVCDKPIQQDIF